MASQLTPKISSDQNWVNGHFGLPMTYLSFIFLALTFCKASKHHKLQGELSFTQDGVVSKKLRLFISALAFKFGASLLLCRESLP
jgi:hypothetical protein